MALSFLRFGLRGGRISSQSLQLLPAVVMTESRAGITNKILREPKTIKPFPYETKRYGFWQGFCDDTEKRFDENTRIIVIEGNLCSGKSTVAKKLAEEFDFVHFPEVNMDMAFIDKAGFDIRSLQHVLPDLLRPFDEKRFYERPTCKLVPNFRNEVFFIRVEQYVDAMAHILNTGQGIVLERSPFSDFVFMGALLKCGYVTKEDMQVHADASLNVSPCLYKPHLIVYLDAPVDVLQKRIMSRGVPHEVNSKIRWGDYLKGIEDQYKQTYLPSMRTESELLIYDWSNFGDPERIVEDIERIDFEKAMNDKTNTKFHQWKNKNTREWLDIRYKVTMGKENIVNAAVCTLRYNTPDVIASAEEVEEFFDAREKYYPNYAPGWDPKDGLSYLWKKPWITHWESQKRAHRTR